MRDDGLPAPARAALAAYRARLADPDDTRPIHVAWAPGRVNLIGEHTDYNDGYVLPVAIDRVVALVGRSLADDAVRLYSAQFDASTGFRVDAAALTTAAPDDVPMWARYVRGVLAELAALPGDLPSTAATGFSLRTPYAGTSVPNSPLSTSPLAFDAAISGDVPLGGGLSSSAALEVATATFVAALGGPALPPMETALLCQRAEHRGVGVRCGILDQAASCLARPGAALLLDCRSLAYEYVPFELPDLAIAIFDTGVPHTLAESGYNERRRECEDAVARLAAALAPTVSERAIRSLRDITTADLAAHADVLLDMLLRRARHVITENERVLRAVGALRARDFAALGRLISESHASLRDDYAVSCPELDAAVAIAQSTAGVLGARMMGAGFGGSALIVVQRVAIPGLEAALARDYPARTGLAGALTVCHVSGGPASAVVTV